MEGKNFKSALKTIFLKYKESHPHLSMRRIAELSGVNRYYLNKVLLGDEDSSPIDLDKTMVLMKFLCQKDRFRDIIDSADDSLKGPLKEIFSVIYGINRDYQQELPDAPLDRCEYFVLVLATFGNGTTRKQIQQILGDQGISVLENFLQDEFVIEKDGAIRLTRGNDFFTTLKAFKGHIPHYADFYNPAHVGQKRNYAAAVVQGFNQEAIELAQSYHRELHEKMVALMENKNHWGNIPFFSVNFADTFLDKMEDNDSN